MSGPTQRLPFLTAAEEACLRPGPSGRVGGVASASDFFTFFLRDSSEFAASFHESLGDRVYKEWPWEQDGQKQYEGSLRKVQFVSPVRNAPELSSETPVEEEQRWFFRGHGNATLEIRRKLPKLRDGDRFVVAVRWVMTFDGFGCNLRIFCGTLFFKSSAYAKEIREGCIRGYSQSSKRWVAQAEKYAKKHDAIHLRPKPWSEDGADGDGRGEGEEEQGQEQERVKRDPSDLLGDMGPVGGGLKKSGRVSVMEAMRSSVGSSNSIQLSKCHDFLGEYIYLTKEIKRVIQGEAAGDLVLEEDLSTGGGGVPIGGGGLAEAHLDSGAGGGSAHIEDIEDSTVISAAMSHMSIESARTGSWSGSAVGGLGYVDYPAGIPPKQWGRIQDRTVRWLMRSGTASNVPNGHHNHNDIHERAMSVISGNMSVLSGSTFSTGGGRVHRSGRVSMGAPGSPTSVSRHRGGDASPSASSAREEDVVHAKWLEQLRVMSQREQDMRAERLKTAEESEDADDANQTEESNKGADNEGTTDAGDLEGSTKGGGDKQDNEPSAEAGSPPIEEPIVGQPAAGSGEKPYTVVFRGRRLGIQLRELHGIPVVGGLQGYDPDGRGDERGEDGEDEDGEEEVVEGLHVEVSPETNAFDEFPLARLGTASSKCQADDLQTIYGGSAGRSGVATETSSLLDSQSDYQEYVKCILQCKQLFGEGVKKLWRWRPTTLMIGEESPDASVVLEGFMKGLSIRLGLGGEHGAGLRVSYLDMDVGGGDGEYVSLDLEAWEDFMESRFKRLSVTIDPAVLSRPPGASDGPKPSEESKMPTSTPEKGSGAAGPEHSQGAGNKARDVHGSVDFRKTGSAAVPETKIEAPSGVSTGERGGEEVVADAAVERDEAGAASRGKGGDDGNGSGDDEDDEDDDGLETRSRLKFYTPEARSEAEEGEGGNGDSGESMESDGMRVRQPIGVSAMDVTRELGPASDGPSSLTEATSGMLSRVVASHGVEDNEGLMVKTSELRGALSGTMFAGRDAEDRTSSLAGEDAPSPRGSTGGQDFGSPTSRDGSVGAPWSPQEGRGADEGGEGGMGRFEGSRRAGSRLSGKKGIGGAGELGRASSEVRGRTGRELDSEDTVTADASAPSTVDTTGRGEGKAARRPCVGSVLVSVNGVRTQGLSFANVVDLLHTRERPIILEYIDSWDTIFHQHHMETQVREKISRETFEQKLGHPLASKLRKKIEEWMSAFRDQNLRAMVAETQAEDEDSDQGAMKSQGPAVMLWSLIRWLEQELPDVGIFNNNHRAGGGLPVMGELQWKDVKQHLERHIFEQVFDRCLTSAPDYGAGDEELTAKLASLRFLLPRHWCVDSLKDSDSARSYGREWELAQGELCRLVEYRCPLDMLDCVKACVRLVALSVEASLARRQRELEEAAALAASAAQGSGSRSGGSVSSRSGKAQRVTFGADDLLAALTWVVVQANPPRLASRLWFTSYYMREGVEGLGEGAYCLTQLSSALEFAKHVDASVLADIGEDELNRGLEVHEATQNMIKAAAEGHSLKKLGTWDWEPFRGTLLASESVSFWLGAGADPNGLSNDQQATALTAAVSYRRRAVLKILLEGAGSGRVDPNTRICPNFGLQRGWTALMVAALMGDMETILALLRMAGVDRRLVCAHGKDAFDYAVQHGHMDVASVLLADPSKATLCQAAKAGNLAYVKALLLQGQDPNELDSTGQYTPVLAAAFLGHIEVLDALLACPVTDPDRPNVRGETALMYCSQREGYATNDSQVAAAVHLLAKGANRHVRDNDGRSAVEWATHFGSTRLMNVLIHDPSKEKIFVRARERDVQGAMALMEQGVDPNTKCPERDYTPLIAAVFNQDEDMASMLLSNQKTDVNSPGRHGMTPLMYSAQAGHEGMAVLLLRLRADRYRCNDKSETALEIAAIRGHMTVVNVIKYDPERLSICSAAANDDGPAIDGLLRQGVSVNSRHRIRTVRGWHHERYTPLIASCHQGHLSMAKRLLNAGADPNLPNLLGQTPLMYAAGFGGEELILELLRALKSGERKALDSQGRTALRFAEAAGHDEVACILRVDPAVCTIQEAAAAGRVSEVWALMRQGVSGNEARLTVMSRLFESARATSASSVMARGNQYRSNFEPNEYMLTPLAAAAIFGNHRVVEALLADRSVKVDKRDPLGRTALMQAARFGSESCVLLLLKHGASRFKRDRSRKTASDHAIHAGNLGIAGIISADPAKVDLMEIASQGRLVLLKGLVKQNVGLNYIERATPHNTPLIVASANGRDECVRVILQCPGVQVNKANAKGETALMYAAASGSLKIVRMLLQHGADPELRDRRQRHVEHWAYKRGHLNMVLVKLAIQGVDKDQDVGVESRKP